MRHPNKIQGTYRDPYTTYANQRFALGQVMEVSDGRLYRFALAGAAALAPSNLDSAKAMTANFDTLAIQATVDAGATTIPFTNGATALVENELAGGTILVEDVALNLGEIYPIKSHASAGGVATCTVTLEDNVTVLNALTTSGKVTVRVNPWQSVIIHGSPPVQLLVGIPQTIIGLTEYGWLQTHGVTNCLIEGSVIKIGHALRASESIDGAVTFLDYTEATQADLGIVGWAVIDDDTSDTLFAPLFLKLD
ncbi:hypothetical protein LCGC14_3060600 [marine sediment metagenome]|uniref:Ubiquitin-activating enzyme E1 FCCH domain-containing protein n=1 Tax=marine sediment metagenome TaxID=412755 RepID=A0A0F8X797_9ZZZZ